MANKTRIEWTGGGSTWNPVTGCLHECGSFDCYAKTEVRRFSGENKDHWCRIEGNELLSHICTATVNYRKQNNDRKIYELEERIYTKTKSGKLLVNPYPYGFAPTFHRYRLNILQTWKSPRNIFVCSMADLFGAWVPDEWIEEVFKACAAAPQHRYLFLTKNSTRYISMLRTGTLPIANNLWYGTSIVKGGDGWFGRIGKERVKRFLSIEPLLCDRRFCEGINVDWVIIGAESGNRKDKIIPKREWIENIVNQCNSEKIPVFMKDSLIPIVGEENMIREFPWEVKS